jgi:voltage-gated potassium channel
MSGSAPRTDRPDEARRGMNASARDPHDDAGAARARPADARAGTHAGFELIVLGFSLLAVGLLIVQYVLPVREETVRLLEWSDLLLGAIFFGDFVRNVLTAPDRRRYLLRSGWLDLASSIPAVDALRLARLGRVLRIVRVIRVLVVSRQLGRRLRESPRENALLTAAFACTVLIITGAVAVLEFEFGRGNIDSASDALWWALATISTVGYGDHTPVTAGGRIVGGVLMLAGVGTFGLMAGLLASMLLGPAVETPTVAASGDAVGAEERVVDPLLSPASPVSTTDSASARPAASADAALHEAVEGLRDELRELRALVSDLAKRAERP